MALTQTNTTCDVYRSGHSPPAAPDVAGVKCLLTPRGQSTLTSQNYTHVMLVGPTVDVRDDYNAGFVAGANADSVYVPDRNGTKFNVILVRRHGRGTPADCKQVLLVRTAGSPTWPSDNV
jgi:hypothetical protein